MSEHKHASVLRAIADGVSLDEFEIEWIHGIEKDAGFKNATFRDLIYAIQFPEHWKIRRKPQHIIVNGFKVPKPLDVLPEDEEWVPDFERDEMVFCYRNDESIRRIVTNKCAHSTKEAAIAHAKAMLGIDPKWEE